MTTSSGYAGIPGAGTLESTSERQILWGGDAAKGLSLWKNEVYSGAARDAGNSPTSVLRAGLLMGKVTSSGLLLQWDTAATDGSQYLYGILGEEIKSTDFNGDNADRVYRVYVKAPVQAAQLLIKGVALTSAADQYLARKMLYDAGFTLDDDPQGFLAGKGARSLAVTTATTVTAAQNGTRFESTGSGSTTFTLPTIAKGLEYEFANLVDFAMIVASAATDIIITINDVAADSVEFSTAGSLIGASCRMTADGAGDKWLCRLTSLNTVTVNT